MHGSVSISFKRLNQISIQIQNLLLLYSVQSEINFMNRYTYSECYDLQLVDMTVPVSGNGLEPNQQQAFTIVNVDLAPIEFKW